tara:strand:- start:150 stop:482 length:333 start_codon:yes stop_codon:yes gene_type:complete
MKFGKKFISSVHDKDTSDMFAQNDIEVITRKYKTSDNIPKRFCYRYDNIYIRRGYMRKMDIGFTFYECLGEHQNSEYNNMDEIDEIDFNLTLYNVKNKTIPSFIVWAWNL